MDKVVDLKKNKLETEAVELEKENYALPVESELEAELYRPSITYQRMPIELSWLGYNRDYPDARFLYIFLGVLGAAASFFIFVQHNIFTAIFFIAAAVFLFIHSFVEPSEEEFFIGPNEVRIGGASYLIRDIKSFWVEYNPGGIKELSLQLKKWHSLYIKINLGDQDPVHVRNILVEYVPEVERQHDITDFVSHGLGF